MDAPPTLLVAADGGPREALAPLAPALGSTLEDVRSDEAADIGYWLGRIDATAPELVVVGTSDSVRGRRVESAARRAACNARIPVAAIEDFPGNYYDVAGGEAALVLVESTAARALCLERIGARLRRVEVAILARYDLHRAQLAEARRRMAQCWSAQTTRRVLWAGQPETDDGVRTLEALFPILREHAVELLFKAHPRDPGYAGGAYRALLEGAGIAVSDLTSATVERAFAHAPRLIVTQFSSIAVEGGFFGVPSLWVLLPEAGGARLQQKKGYAIPPLCLARGAACATAEGSLAEAFARALADIGYRENLMCCFDDYYSAHELGAAQTLSLLREAAGTK